MGDDTTAALWWAVVASGAYHGVNPGMGWPLAVSAALMERRAGAMPKALMALGAGHLAAMLLVLAPFTVLSALIVWEREIRLLSAFLVIGLGVYLFIDPRHPRFLARVPPSRLALWSFLAAMAHGAGMMLLPIYLGICGVDADAGHRAAYDLLRDNAGTALMVAAAHTLAMVGAGGALAAVTYYAFGLKFLSMAWFNLDRVWAASLVLVGGLAAFTATH